MSLLLIRTPTTLSPSFLPTSAAVLAALAARSTTLAGDAVLGAGFVLLAFVHAGRGVREDTC